MKNWKACNFTQDVSLGGKGSARGILGRGILGLLALLLVVTASSAVLGGCGKEESPGDKTIRIGALKGATAMGLLPMLEERKNSKEGTVYEFRMAVGADELLSLLASDQLDIALVPANTAAILYQKTEGAVSVIDINSVGVLYLVSGDADLRTIDDLKGRTIYLTGKGTSPDYVLQYLLRENGISREECTLEYRSEATEVASILAENSEAVGFLPQPFATAACMQNEALREVFSARDLWPGGADGEKNGEENGPVIGVTVVRKAFLQEHPNAVEEFLTAHARSTEDMVSDPETGGELCVEYGIVGKAAIARKAIPHCGISCITGEAMKEALESYLTVLYEFGKESVGGALPGEDFYYLP